MVSFMAPSPATDEAICPSIPDSLEENFWRIPQHLSIVCPPKFVPFILLSLKAVPLTHTWFSGLSTLIFHLFLSLVLFFQMPLYSMLQSHRSYLYFLQGSTLRKLSSSQCTWTIYLVEKEI